MNKGIARLCENTVFAAAYKRTAAEREKSVIELLELYAAEIERFNRAYGLVSLKSHEELIVRHILDSIAPLGIILNELEAAFPANQEKPEWEIGDLGSGAGLPGIPLAITLGDCAHLTLIERMKRRVNFLCGTQAVLGLSNVDVFDSSSGPPPRKFNAITFRAVHELDASFAALCNQFLLSGGFIAAYKGRRESVMREAALCKASSCELNFSSNLISYKTPFLDVERTMLLLRQEKSAHLPGPEKA